MCSLNRLYVTATQHAHSTPRVSELARGPVAPGVGTSDAGPPGQGAGILTPGTSRSPRGRKGADTGLMGSTRQTGAYQTACDHNQQRPRTMNAIIYKNTVQVSSGLSLLRLFTLTLRSRGGVGGAVTLSAQSSAGLSAQRPGPLRRSRSVDIRPYSAPAGGSVLPRTLGFGFFKFFFSL